MLWHCKYMWSTWWQCCTVFGTTEALCATNCIDVRDNTVDYAAAMCLNKLKSAVVKMLKHVRSKRFFPYQKRQLSYRNQTFRQEGNNCNHSWLTTQPLFSHEAFRHASITSWISRQTWSKSPRPPPRAFSRSAHRWAKLDSANCAIK